MWASARIGAEKRRRIRGLVQLIQQFNCRSKLERHLHYNKSFDCKIRLRLNDMRAKHLLPVLLMLAMTIPNTLFAQRASAPSPDTAPPLLTLDDAVSLALTNNRLVKNSVLEAQKHDFRVDTIRSRRLPQFNFSVLGGELMHSFDFTFPEGSFGT